MDAGRDLPDLIRSHVPSVWALEVLLLMRRTSPRVWTLQALTQELRAALPLVAASVERFETSGLVLQDPPGAYAYAPATALLSDFAAALEWQYKERPVAVISLIAAPADRIQQLADAFRFRPEDKR
jgi:hypothetical protein